MAKNLINSYYTGFVLYIVSTIVIAIVVLLLVLFRSKILLNMKKILFIAIILVSAFVGIFTLYKSIIFSKDLDLIKSQQFETIKGTVVSYTYVREGNDPTDPIYGNPIFDVGNGNQMVLNVGPTELGKTYEIIYLPNCKLAEIVRIVE